MKKAVQFGAGNIGRGFIGELESLSGYQVVFADVVQPLIDGINADGHYTVHITDVKPRDITVSDISAVNSGSEDIKEEVASAEVITTAVGLGVLPKIAPALAGALSYRFSKGIKDPVNVIACENALRASSKLKEFVYGLLSDDDKAEADRSVGFADCSVDRIVPPIRSANLDVSVEEFYEWNVERSQIVGTPPVLKGMNLVEDVMAYEQRKLFTLNTAHAVAAYFGYAKGFDTIAKSIADETVFPFVMGAVRESGDALCREFGFDHDAHSHYIDTVVKRFNNPYLTDNVTRVGRDPLRKLGPEDRLVKPLTTALKYGLPVDFLIVGIAAALHYDFTGDRQAVELQKKIAEDGIAGVVADVCGIPASSPVSERISEEYGNFSERLHI